MRASEILALAVKARGRRRWPVDSAARAGSPASSAASDGGAPGIGYQLRALRGVQPGRICLPRALSARANTSSTVPTASTVLRSAL